MYHTRRMRSASSASRTNAHEGHDHNRQPNEGNPNANANPSAKASKRTHQTKPRRALGDITNATRDRERPAQETKKPHIEVVVEPDIEEEDEDQQQQHVEEVEIMALDEEFDVEAEAERMTSGCDGAVEMTTERPYMSRDVDDIDRRDSSNPAMVTEYVNDLYELLRENEITFQIDPEYMHSQGFINHKMRAILVDWMVEVHSKFKMHSETLFLSVWILDRYLQFNNVRRSKLQLVGVASLLVAAKYEEIYPPELRALESVTDRAYDKDEILEMESTICTALEFRITAPTIHSFVCRYVKAAHADTKMIQMSCYLSERCLQEYDMLQFLPSVIAASAVKIARKTLHRNPWSPTLLHYTQYDEADLNECIQTMQVCFSSTKSTSTSAVERKYGTKRNGEVSELEICY